MFKYLAPILALAMPAFAAVKIEKVPYKGWPNCYRMSNGTVELILTTDIGPRIISFGFTGGQNVFKEYAEQIGKSGEKEWMARGGHRIWFAPEDAKLTYPADNFPVKIDIKGDTVELTAPVEPDTGFEKHIIVKLASTGSAVEVRHRIKNTAAVPKDFAPWALTQMAPGGIAITGFPPRGTHPEVLAPTNPLVMWAFTDFSDKRWVFTKKYLLLKQDAHATAPQKTGLFNANTWGAYLLGSDLFLKQLKADPKKHYPDFGCSYETFSNADMLELETLGPLVTVKTGGSLEHVEHWTLHKNIKIGSYTDDALDKVFLPLLK
jgi:hypothetical protein